MTAEPQQRFSKVTFGVLVAILVALVAWAVYVFFITDRSMEIYDLTRETKQIASTLFFEKMTAVAQVTLAIIGGVWALLMFGADRIKRSQGFSRNCFWLANIAFGASLLVYAFGYDFIVERLFHHGAFDIDAPFIVGLKNCQLALFVKGCIDLGALALAANVKL